MKKLISIVLPCHNEEKNLNLLIPEIIKNIPRDFSYEIICVNDGSSDGTLRVIKKLAAKNKNIKGISFYKRCGHEMALFAGIKNAKGDAIITMDADFQHPPQMIPKMIFRWMQGNDLVVLKKAESGSGLINKTTRNLGYTIWKWVSDGILEQGVSNFCLMDRQVKNFVTKTHEIEMLIRGLVRLGANNPVTISYKVGKRKFGKSSYDFWRFRNLFFSGLISFSVKPLRIATYLGLALGVLSAFFLLIDALLAVFAGRRVIEGYLTIVFLMIVLNGFIIFYLGIMGEYLGVIFKEVKRRPKYVIEEKINFK